MTNLSPRNQSILASALATIGAANLPKAPPRKPYLPVQGIRHRDGLVMECPDVMEWIERVRIRQFSFWLNSDVGDPMTHSWSVFHIPTATLYLKGLDGSVCVVVCEGTPEASAFVLKVRWSAVEGE